MTTVTYQQLTGEQARDIVLTLHPIYATVFSLPPYNEGPDKHEAFLGWVRSESEHPGFEMHVAYADSRPVGFAYGYTMPAGEWFRNTGRPAPAEIKAAKKFAVMEWAVLPEHRGGGVGRTLMRSLLDTRPEPWAVLTVHPEAKARAIYQRAGWRHLATTKPSRNWPGMDIMVLQRQQSGWAR